MQFIFAFLFALGSLGAVESLPVRSQHTEATLLSEVSAAAPGQAFTVALRLRMDPHWHTYYLDPGDSGLATSIEWELPPGFTAGEIQWPTPQKILQPPLSSNGYEGEVWLLTTITPSSNLKAGENINITAQVRWLECAEVCIPGKATLSLTLPIQATATLSPLAAQFETARSKLEKAQPALPPTSSPSALLISLLFAFLGGLILNLMPCVLPVLSLKVLGLVEQAKQSRTSSLLHGLAFTAGVLLTFWSLAGLLLALQAAGQSLGWGFQLQNPIVVTVLVVLFFAIALNLFGVFEIGTSLTSVHSEKQGLLQSFLGGLLATIVATPCTAPFMGSALGFALGQPAAVALLVFTFLGLGMAAPYLLLSANPSLLRYVPKPGAWMETFKQVMGFPMLATVLWLLWVLSDQLLPEALIAVLCGLLIISFAAWIYGRYGGMTQPSGTRLVAGFLALALTIVGLSVAIPAKESRQTGTSADSRWEKFDPARVTELRAKGTPIFIDFTATWCLTCQVNKRIALNTEAVQKKFHELGVVTMKADWTNQDPVITKALAEFGRNSVPVYVLYGRSPQADPQLLPEILSQEIVLRALEKLNQN